MAWFGGEHRNENAALLVLAVFVLLTAAYALVTHPAQDAHNAELDRVMPPDYRPVLAALIRASGGECDSVCSASVTEPPLGQLRVRAACAVTAKRIGCDNAREFDVVVTPAAPNPSR